jgi:hypothetical protein
MNSSSTLPGIVNPLTTISHAVGLSNTLQFLPLVLAVIFVAWIVFSIVAAYHLLRYGHSSIVTIPALAVHLFISATLFTSALASIT